MHKMTISAVYSNELSYISKVGVANEIIFSASDKIIFWTVE